MEEADNGCKQLLLVVFFDQAIIEVGGETCKIATDQHLLKEDCIRQLLKPQGACAEISCAEVRHGSICEKHYLILYYFIHFHRDLLHEMFKRSRRHFGIFIRLRLSYHVDEFLSYFLLDLKSGNNQRKFKCVSARDTTI